MKAKLLIAIIILSVSLSFTNDLYAWNQPPNADLEVTPVNVLVGGLVTFDASGSDDPDGSIVEYAWDFQGDSIYDEIHGPGEPVATYDEYTVGTYNAKLRVKDNGSPPSYGYDTCQVHVYQKASPNEPIYVDKNVDVTDPCYVGNGSSWSNAYQELRDALVAEEGGALIYVAEGTYLPTDNTTYREASFVLKPFMDIYGGFSPTNGINEPGEQNPAAYPTILSGDIDDNSQLNGNSYHVVVGADGALLNGFTITGGNANDVIGHPGCEGGGIYCTGSSPIIVNCVITDNYALFGGGMQNKLGAHPTLTNCVFSKNQGGNGSGISNNHANPELTNCVFSGNSSSSNGGGIYNYGYYGPTKPVLTNCTFVGNSAAMKGGGIYNDDNSGATVTNCIFWGNTATDGPQIALVNESELAAGYSDVNGGQEGIYNDGTGEIDWGDGNINDDPRFADVNNPAGTDGVFTTLDDGLRLWGRKEDPNWIHSPCVDTADACAAPAEDIAGRGRINVPYINDGNAGCADMGAYESMTIWFVDKDATDGNDDGTSWLDAFVDLQSALDNNELVAGHEIWVAEGIYEPNDSERSVSFQLVEGVAIYGGFNGLEFCRPHRNWIVNETVLSGDIDSNEQNSYHVVKAVNISSAVLDGFTISDGNANGPALEKRGGGIYNINSSPTITNCVIRDNFAIFGGGGMYNVGNSSPIVKKCEFMSNLTDGGGGGMLNYVNDDCTPILTDCIFSNNRAVGDWGGAMFNFDCNNLKIFHCVFNGNQAAQKGGAVCNSSSSPTVFNCTFSGNCADINNGGGIYNDSLSAPNVVNCTFSGNEANYLGGGIYSESNHTVKNCIFWGNVSGDPNIEEQQLYPGPASSDVNHSCIEGFSGDGNNIGSNPLFKRGPDPGQNGWDGLDDDYGNLRLRDPDGNNECIDVGDNNAIPSGVTRDLDGDRRIVGFAVDMGAYEFNHRPFARGDEATTVAGMAIVIDVLANDEDIDAGDTNNLRVWSIEQQAANGWAKNNGRDVTYTPDSDFTGQDIFIYKTSDGYNCSNGATVTVDVLPSPYLQVDAGEDKILTWLEGQETELVELADANYEVYLDLPVTLQWSIEDDSMGGVDYDPETAGKQTVSSQLNPTIELTVDNNMFKVCNELTFVLRLTATCGDVCESDDVLIIVQPDFENQPPEVEAGEYAPIILPGCDYVDLNGTVTDDGLPYGTIFSRWEVKEPPDIDVFFDDCNLIDTTALFSEEEEYELVLFASDGNSKGEDVAVIKVERAGGPNQKPKADAGPDYTIDLDYGPETPSVEQCLSEADASDDGPLTIHWTGAGPQGGCEFDNDACETPTVTFTKPGVYTLTMLVSDGYYTESDFAFVTVQGRPEVDAGETKEGTLSGGSCFIDLDDALDRDNAFPYNNQSRQWILDPNYYGGEGTEQYLKWREYVDFNSSTGGIDYTTEQLNPEDVKFTESGTYRLRLTVTDTDFPASSSASDTVYVTIYPEEPNSEIPRANVYVLPEEYPSSSSIGRLGFLNYEYGGDVTFIDEIIFGDANEKIYCNTLDIAYDPESRYLFISALCSNFAGTTGECEGIILVNEITKEFEFIELPHTVGCIDFDNTKSSPKLYIIDYTDQANRLYVYDWDSDKKKLSFEKTVNLSFGNCGCSYPDDCCECEYKDDCDALYDEMRLDPAFDEYSEILYVTFARCASPGECGFGVTDIVYGYDTNDWGLVRRIVTSDYEERWTESGHPFAAFFIDVYNDGEYTYLYTTGWDGDYLGRTKFKNTDINDIERAHKYIGGPNSIYGIGVDEHDGDVDVWVTVAYGEKQIRVYDGLSENWGYADQNELYPIEDGEGPIRTYDSNSDELVISYQPRSIIADGTKDSFDYDGSKAITKSSFIESDYEAVSPVDESKNEITYQITYNIYYEANEVYIADKLPHEVDFVSASHQGVYNPADRVVSWYMGDVSQDSNNTDEPFELTVRVNKEAIPGSKIVNYYCKIESVSKVAYSEAVETDVEWWAERLYVDQDAPAGGDGITWETAYQTLQDALLDAKRSTDIDTGMPGIREIWVAAGTYSPGDYKDFTFRLVDNVSLYGGFAGTEKDLDERDLANPANETILSGLDDFQQRDIDNVVTAANNSRLDGFTIEGAVGSGIFCKHVDTPTIIYVNQTIANCTIENNRTGIFTHSLGQGNKTEIVNCDIYDNDCGIYSWLSPQITIRNCGVMYNSYNGIELESCGGGSAIVENCWIYKNGCCGIRICSNYGNTKIYNSTIVGNGAEPSDKRLERSCRFSWPEDVNGIECIDSLDIDVNHCIVWGNYGKLQISGCDANYSYIGDANSPDPFFDSAGDDYHLRADSPNCIDLGNRFITVTSDIGGPSEIVVDDTSSFAIGDIIEIANDGMPRIVEGVNGNTITFEPNLCSDSTAGMEVINWRFVDYFQEEEIPCPHDDCNLITDTSVEGVTNVGLYRENDLLHIETKLGGLTLYDEFYGVVTDVDKKNNIVYFDIVYIKTENEITKFPCSACYIYIGCYRIANKTDIDGQPRILSGVVDIGADEFSPVEVYAGKDKRINLTSLATKLHLEDASIAILDGNAIDANYFTLEWSSQPADGINFDGEDTSSVLNPVATFEQTGRYKLTLRAFDGINLVGSDSVNVSVELGMALASEPAEILIPYATAILTAGDFIGGTPNDIEWHCLDGAGFEPETSTVTDGNSQTDITFGEKPAIYTIVAEAFDSNDNYLGKSEMVLPVNYQEVIVDAVADRQQIVFPDNRVYLYGIVSGRVPDSSEWSIVGSNADCVVFDNSTQLHTYAEFSEPGVYHIALKVYEESELIGLDVTTITVDKEQVSNIYAGRNQQISLPYDTVLLSGLVGGIGTDYYTEWNEPTGLIDFADFDSLSTLASFSEAGIYRIDLLVRGNGTDEVLGEDSVLVVVEPETESCDVNAGYDQTAVLSFDNVAQVILEGDVNASDYYVKWIAPSNEPVVEFIGGIDNQQIVDVLITEPGRYLFGFEARDDNNDKLLGLDTVEMTVQSFDGKEVSVTADSNQPITFLYDEFVNLNGEFGEGLYDDIGWSSIFENERLEYAVSFAGRTDVNKTAASFTSPGIYAFGLYAFYDEWIVGRDIIQVVVDYAEVAVQAKVVDNDNKEWDEYVCYIENGQVQVDLTGSVIGVRGDVTLTYEWTSEPNSPVIDPNGQTDSPSATATFTEAGSYELTLTVWYNSDVLDDDIIRIVVLSDAPIALAGRGYPMVIPDETIPLDKAAAWCVPGRELTYYWSSEPWDGVSIDEADDLQPNVTFSNEGTYKLTLEVNDSILTDSDFVDIVVKYPAVYAGSPKSTMPYHAVLLDALVNPRYYSYTYEWKVESGPNDARIEYDPSDEVLNPYVSFSKVSDYTLRLNVYKGELLYGTDSVDIEVVNPIGDDDEPQVSISDVNQDDEVCGEINITVTAEDDHLAEAYLLLDGDKELKPHQIDIIKGTKQSPQELKLYYTLDTHSISKDSHTITAYAFDMAGNESSDDVTFSNTCQIYNFTVEPNIVTETTETLTFTADFDPATSSWTLEIFDPNNNDVCDCNGEGTIYSLGQGVTVTPGDFNPCYNGRYEAKLTASNDIAYVYFDVAIGMTYADLVAEFSSKIKPKYLYEADGVTVPDTTRYVITEGLFDLEGKAYHPAFDEVCYRIELYDGKGFYKNVTPGCLEDGYAKGSVGTAYEDGVFGTIDLTTVPNGLYTLKLKVKCHELTKTDTVEVAIDCPLKLGNVKFTQEDLVIPVGGYPLRIVRTYDGFNRNKRSDFGYGWTYSLANMDIELNETRLPREDNEEFTVRSGDPFDRDVTLTLPDGRRVTFVPTFNGSGGNMSRSWNVGYSSPEGVAAELTTKELEKLYFQNPAIGGYGWWWEGYSLLLRCNVNLSLHDFSGYTLRMEDGTIYNIEREGYTPQDVHDPFADETAYRYWPYGQPYLSSIELPSGETIEFDVDVNDPENPRTKFVKFYPAGYPDFTKCIRIERDDYGRIKEVYPPSELDLYGEPDGEAFLKYFYDTHGNLAKVYKLKNRYAAFDEEKYNITTYVYDDEIYDREDHYVTDIIDSRGLSPIQYVYNNDGQLIAVKDARGNVIELSHDVAGNTEIVTDRLGNITEYVYDERGRVTEETKYVDGNSITTEYKYDLYEYKGCEFINSCTDNPCVIASPLDSNTYFDYDASGRTLRTIDAEDNITEYVYDSIGNVTRTIQGFDADVYLNVITYEKVSETVNQYYYRDGGTLNTNYQGEPTNLLYFTEIKDSNGLTLEQTEYEYDNQSRLNEVRKNDPNGDLDDIVTTYGYESSLSNSVDQPSSITDPAGFIQYFYYDDNGNQIASWYKWQDPSGLLADCNVYTHTLYDDAGRVVQTSRQLDELWYDPYIATVLSQTWYNEIGKPDIVINEYGAVTKYEYDETGNLVETKTYESYDAYDTDPAANILTISRTLYDAEGRVLLATDLHDPAEAANGTEYVYDELGRTVKTRRWENVEIPLEDLYGTNGKVGKKVPDIAAPRNAWGTNDGESGEPPVGLNIGWVSSELVPKAGEELSYTKTIYDAAGQVKMTITLDEGGYEQPTGYKYDAAGKQIAVADANDYGLEAADYIEKDGWYVIDQNVLAEDIETYNNVSTTQYEGNRRESVTDDRGFTTSFEYDALGRIIKTVHPNSVVAEAGPNAVPTYTHVGYDCFGRKSWESNPVIEELADYVDGNEIKTFEYDNAGRLAAVVLPQVPDPENSYELTNPRYRYYYDIYGNLIATLDPKGRVTRFTYNELNQQVKRFMPFAASLPAEPNVSDILALDLSDIDFEQKDYDALSRLVKATDFKGQITGYFYNNRGLLEYEQYYHSDADYPAEPAKVIQYTYDNLGRKRQVFVDTQLEQEFDYDAEGRIRFISSPQGDIGYDYSLITGRKEFVCTPTDCDDTEIEYTYDILGRLSEVIVHKRNGQSASETTTYWYNSAGSIEKIEYPNGNTAEYSYDALNRLKNLINKDASEATLSSYAYELYADGMRSSVAEADGTIINWDYDNLNRLAEEDYDATGTANDYIDGYTYDLVGNRKIKTSDSTPTYYFYNEQDQLEKECSDIAGENILVSYNYDDNGSLKSKTITGGDTYDYVYNLQGRLEQLQVNSTPIVNYEYNSDGVRIGKGIIGGITTDYIIDSINPTGYTQVLKEKPSTGDDTVYIIGNDVIGQAVGTSNPVYLLYDGHGSVRQLANSSGDLIAGQVFDYDAYGNIIDTVTPQTNLLYSGEWRDFDSGFDYLRARWYNPAIGRFNRTDPFAGSPQDPISLHKYLYCHADPTNGIDPLGLEWTLTQKVVVLGIAMNIASFSMNVTRGLIEGVQGNYAESNEAFAWALIDAAFLSMPFAGPGAGMVQTAGPLVQNVMCLSKAGMSISALWGYVRAAVQFSSAVGVGGSGGGGGDSSSGPRGGEFMENEGPGAWYKFTVGKTKWQQLAAKYQSFINRKPLGWDYYYNGYRFDGWENGRLLEAKHGYESLVQKRTGRFYKFYEEVLLGIAKEMKETAGDIPIVMRWSSPEACEAARKALGNRYPTISIENVPML